MRSRTAGGWAAARTTRGRMACWAAGSGGTSGVTWKGDERYRISDDDMDYFGMDETSKTLTKNGNKEVESKGGPWS